MTYACLWPAFAAAATRRQGTNRNPGDGYQAARADEPVDARQIIPATRLKQNAWLQALQNWCDWMAAARRRNTIDVCSSNGRRSTTPASPTAKATGCITW